MKEDNSDLTRRAFLRGAIPAAVGAYALGTPQSSAGYIPHTDATHVDRPHEDTGLPPTFVDSPNYPPFHDHGDSPYMNHNDHSDHNDHTDHGDLPHNDATKPGA